MTMPLSLGYSPCPNDTFIFYALVHGKIPADRLTLREPQLEDVEQLNQWALAGRLDITKLSFHALGHVLDEYCMLGAGSALGRGCGPLLVAGPGVSIDGLEGKRIAIPGRLTTAAMLLKMFRPSCGELVEMRFDKIIPALCNKEIDAGVIIHESRFTYQTMGLQCLQDLGAWWEDTVRLPIPLGCIAARRSLGADVLQAVDRAIRASVEYAFSFPSECMPYIYSRSQEMDPAVVRSHIDLYVTDFSKDIGSEGMAAVETFFDMGQQAGALPKHSKSLTCLA